MGDHSVIKSNSTVRWTCAITFIVFAFLWLYRFQTDVLAAAQHVLSGGKTTYNPLLGAVLITVLLMALQLLVWTILRLRGRGHALTYFPSMLALALISAINTDVSNSYAWGFWWLLVPLVLIGWVGVCLVVRYIQNVEPDKDTNIFFSRPMWINMLVMFLMMVGVAAVGNTNAVFHYRMRAETCLLKGDYEGALEVGSESLESDIHLQMIRMYAMALRGELGERLFHYPVVGKSSDMLPTSNKACFVRYPNERIKISKKMHRDYELCGLLIDRRLDDFVTRLQRYYTVGDSLDTNHLPKHYREALTLYSHSRHHPVLVYHNPVMEEDYRNLQELERQYPDATERQGKVEDLYGDTYWYYFKYPK